MSVVISSAANSTELQSVLKSIDISVPLRTEKRLSEHTETWAICRLMATLVESNLVTYPVSIQHRERPDFLLQFGETQIGVEVTEAISEQYAEYSALAQHEFPDAFLEAGCFRWGAPKLTTDEIRSRLRQDQLTSSPWVGDRAEREWALNIQSVVKSKLVKLANPEFSHFSENWLSIYDNLPLCHIDLEKALSFLRPALAAFWSLSPTFSTVYVEHGSVIVRLSRSEVHHLLLCDLW